MVYCIGNRKKKLCKIGFTARTADERLLELRQTLGGNIVVLGTVDGLRKEEAAFHKQFKEHQIQGEMFNLVPEIAEAFNFDIDEPEVLWVVYLLFADKQIDGTTYLNFMCSVFAPTKAEAELEAREKAYARDEKPRGHMVRAMAICIGNEDIEKAYELLQATPTL